MPLIALLPHRGSDMSPSILEHEPEERARELLEEAYELIFERMMKRFQDITVIE